MEMILQDAPAPQCCDLLDRPMPVFQQHGGVPSFMKTVTLDTGEIEIAKAIARARSANNRMAGVTCQMRSPAPPCEEEMNGFGAEIAYCKAFNLYPDFSVIPKKGGHDCVHCGKTVDVKATPHTNGRLLVLPHKESHGVDMYALVTGWMPHYTIVGYATRDEVFRNDNMMDMGHGESHAIEQEELHEFNDKHQH